MWNFLKNRWTFFWQQRKQAKELAPEAFRQLVQEILELVGMIEKIQGHEDTIKIKLAQLQREIMQLQDLLQKKKFKRLSQTKRLTLKNNLVFSRNQLLDAMRSVPPPTDLIQ